MCIRDSFLRRLDHQPIAGEQHESPAAGLRQIPFNPFRPGSYTHLELEKPIKSEGEHEVVSKVHPQVEATLKVVVKENA